MFIGRLAYTAVLPAERQSGKAACYVKSFVVCLLLGNYSSAVELAVWSGFDLPSVFDPD